MIFFRLCPQLDSLKIILKRDDHKKLVEEVKLDLTENRIGECWLHNDNFIKCNDFYLNNFYITT